MNSTPAGWVPAGRPPVVTWVNPGSGLKSHMHMAGRLASWVPAVTGPARSAPNVPVVQYVYATHTDSLITISPRRVLQAATARLDFNAVLLMQLAIDPSNLPPSPCPAAQEPGMPLVPLRWQQDGSRCVGMQQAIAAPRGMTPPKDRIVLQMLMQRAGSAGVPVQVGNELTGVHVRESMLD